MCPSTHEWMAKWGPSIKKGYYSVLKRDNILTHAMTWMSLEDTLLIERSQSQKDKSYMSSLLSKLRDTKWKVGAGARGGQMGHSC